MDIWREFRKEETLDLKCQFSIHSTNKSDIPLCYHCSLKVLSPIPSDPNTGKKGK